jgi:competence protein ComEC
MCALVMFSCIAIGKVFNKKSPVFYSLSAAAFMLLGNDPFLLWDEGFQLSYFGVPGIVISQRYIYNWFYFKNKILNEAWEIDSVSLASQAFTLPASPYYYHQVPLLFIVTNITAIPFAIFMLYGCILLIVISPFHPLALFVGKLLNLSIWLMNHAVLFIKAIPFSLWYGVSITVGESIILYFIIIFFLH